MTGRPKINDEDKCTAHKQQLQVWLEKSFIAELRQEHKNFCQIHNLKVTFGSFVTHMLRKAIQSPKDNGAK